MGKPVGTVKPAVKTVSDAGNKLIVHKHTTTPENWTGVTDADVTVVCALCCVAVADSTGEGSMPRNRTRLAVRNGFDVDAVSVKTVPDGMRVVTVVTNIEAVFPAVVVATSE